MLVVHAQSPPEGAVVRPVALNRELLPGRRTVGSDDVERPNLEGVVALLQVLVLLRRSALGEVRLLVLVRLPLHKCALEAGDGARCGEAKRRCALSFLYPRLRDPRSLRAAECGGDALIRAEP